MNIKRETKNARAAIRGFNSSRGKRYAGGDEADLADLLTALMVMCHEKPEGRARWFAQLHRAENNFSAEYRK